MTNRPCKVVHSFVARRILNPSNELQFQIGDTVWYDLDQQSDPVEFYVDNDPYTVDRNTFLSSIEPPN